MPRQLPQELIFHFFALLIAFILVHGAYVTVIRPQAAAFVAAEQAQLTADPEYVQQRNFYVVIKDYEQETCFVLMLWAIAILGYKASSRIPLPQPGHGSSGANWKKIYCNYPVACRLARRIPGS